jgi:gliding motility-associated-like protein
MLTIVDPDCTVSTGAIKITSSTTGLLFSLDGGAFTSYPAGGWSGLSSGSHTIAVQNAAGCSTTINATINTQPQAPQLITNPATACAPATVDLTAPSITAGSDAGLTFTYWTNSAATTPLVNPSAIATSGTYYIKATSAAGCTSIKPVVVSIGSAGSFVVTNPIPVCAPGTVDLTAPSITAGSDPGLTYTYWMDAANTIPLQNPSAVGVSGIYYIKATSLGGCSFTKSVQVIVKVNETIQAMRYPTVVTDPNIPVQLVARNLGINYTYAWNPPVGLNSPVIRNPIFNYNRETEYTITITPPDGSCPTVDTVRVVLKEIPNACKSVIDVPKAWSPNGDGHNDKLYPLTICIRELKYFRVFNRWGQLMFETNILGKGWDGIFNGKQQVMDVYTWTLEAIGEDGVYYKRAGNSALMR